MAKPHQLGVNGKIKAPTVRVITEEKAELSVYSLNEALKLAQTKWIDLVEIGSDDIPPTCLLIDYGKFAFQQRNPTKDEPPTT